MPPPHGTLVNSRHGPRRHIATLSLHTTLLPSSASSKHSRPTPSRARSPPPSHGYTLARAACAAKCRKWRFRHSLPASSRSQSRLCQCTRRTACPNSTQRGPLSRCVFWFVAVADRVGDSGAPRRAPAGSVSCRQAPSHASSEEAPCPMQY